MEGELAVEFLSIKLTRVWLDDLYKQRKLPTLLPSFISKFVYLFKN